ncbi:hypothetical protein GAYE_SCF48G5992 [Galdieria yellowstonensis]|uniref:MYND-type domain-containing protein n=1 Tax=Galdieria yellowstonensis TaxID=3028027 RepID=A0AAV9ILA3_9RHOD|nr:hypothetical protein GAYE_SCF48G5992 [Galdieria yellowstonensis]
MESWLQHLEKQLEEAKNCNDKRVAEEKVQDVLKSSSEMSNLLVSLLPEPVRGHWQKQLERLENEKTQKGVCCSYCANIISSDRMTSCPLGCPDKFCNKTCLKKGLEEHRKRCFMDKKRKLRKALEQNSMEW